MNKEVLKMEKSIVMNDVNFKFVDLGLSVKWANMNMGANSSTEKGMYYAWNEVKLDDEGRLPSEAEMMELIEKCNWEWVSKDGKVGYNVRSRINNNEIFLPAAGLMAGDKLCLAGEMGYYLSSTIKENPTGAAELIISPKYRGIYLAGSYKRTVRLVSEK